MLARSLMDEAFLFGENGFAKLFSKSRGDLFLLLDDGWDVSRSVCDASFGSLAVDEDKFPFVRGLAPWERLRVLCERVKALGWKGLGVWIAAQCCGELYNKPFSDEVKDYFRERLVWSKQAGVGYWKVDWGTYGANHEFRAFLTEEAKAIYPELVIEHAVCCDPLNGVKLEENDPLCGRAAGDRAWTANAEKTLAYSEIFRSYDVLAPLSVATTLDRLAVLLPAATGYINAEDELYIAAALGCQMGVMRSALGSFAVGSTVFNGKIGEQGTECNRLDEVDAAVAWQREFPPFTGGQVAVSDEVLFDEYSFDEGETWYGVAHGKKIRQGAPAAIARNAALPRYARGAARQKPFVCVSRHPNGNYAVCISPRTVGGTYGFVGGEITCELAGKPKLVAVFGEAERVSFELSEAPRKVTARSMLAGKAETLEYKEGKFVLTKEQIRRLWQSNDKSLPAILVQIEYINI